MKLNDLPAVMVDEIAEVGDEVRVRGRFTHLAGVCLGTSNLYCGDAQWPVDLVELDRASRQAVLTTPLWVLKDIGGITLGSVVPWLPAGWQYFHVNRVLAPASSWELRTFVASDAQHFRSGSSHGWTKAGEPLRARDVPTYIEPGGWDHEECGICYAHIGRGGSAEGYVNQDDAWLCQACYEQYARTHDLHFIFPETPKS